MIKVFPKIFLIFFFFFCFPAKANYYNAFGVAQNASMKEIHAGYRKAIRPIHPDGYTDPEEKREMTEVFKNMQEWYAVLKDPQQRRLYDEFLRDTANDSQREDFKDWKDRRFSGSGDYGRANSSSNRGSNQSTRNRRNGSQQRDSHSRNSRNRGSRANSSSQNGSSSHSQNSSHQSESYHGTQLHEAIQFNNYRTAYRFVKDILKRGEFDINARDSNGETALTLAVRRDLQDIVSLLLDISGLDINAKNNTGETALTLAVEINAKGIVSLLLTRGADPNIPGPDGNPLTHVLLSNMEKRRYRENSSRYHYPLKPLKKAYMKSSLGILYYLKKFGINSAAKNPYGLTALHFSLLNNFFYYRFEEDSFFLPHTYL